MTNVDDAMPDVRMDKCTIKDKREQQTLPTEQ